MDIFICNFEKKYALNIPTNIKINVFSNKICVNGIFLLQLKYKILHEDINNIIPAITQNNIFFFNNVL